MKRMKTIVTEKIKSFKTYNFSGNSLIIPIIIAIAVLVVIVAVVAAVFSFLAPVLLPVIGVLLLVALIKGILFRFKVNSGSGKTSLLNILGLLDESD